MKLLKLQHHLHLHPHIFSTPYISQNTPHHFFFLSPPPHPPPPQLSLYSNFIPASPSVFHSTAPPSFKIKSLDIGTPIWSNPQDGILSNASGEELEDLAADGEVYQKTLRLVECSMFAAVSGLAYFLSNSLAIENYFGCFFALPIVISSMRWSIAAGRKTMVATAVLLFVISGPVKALTYLLMHGLVGLTMGSMWRLGASWGLSIFMCSLVRAVGAMGYVLLSSFLIRENILALITINIHASLTYIMTSLGLSAIPSMEFIYAFFGTVLLLNCGFFVFLLHLLYAVFFAKLGMKNSLRLPRWLEKAI